MIKEESFDLKVPVLQISQKRRSRDHILESSSRRVNSIGVTTSKSNTNNYQTMPKKHKASYENRLSIVTQELQRLSIGTEQY